MKTLQEINEVSINLLEEIGHEGAFEIIKQLTEERDTYKQALDELGVTPAEAKAGVARSNWRGKH